MSIDNEIEKAIGEALADVPQEWHKDFRNFVKDGKAGQRFLGFLDRSQECQTAVEAVFDAQAKTLQGTIGRLEPGVTAQRSFQREAVGTPESQSATGFPRLLTAALIVVALGCVGSTIWSRGQYEVQRIQIAELQDERDTLLTKNAQVDVGAEYLVSSWARTDWAPSGFVAQDLTTYRRPMDDYLRDIADIPNWYEGLYRLTKVGLYREVYAGSATYKKLAESSKLEARVYNMLGVATGSLWREAFKKHADIEIVGTSVSAADLYDEAERYYEKSIAMGKDLEDEEGQLMALTGCANMYLRQEKTRDKARDFLVQARKLRPFDPSPLYNLLCYHSLKKNLDKCEELHDEFYRIESNTRAQLRDAKTDKQSVDRIAQLKERVDELRYMLDHMNSDPDLDYFLNNRRPLDASEWTKLESRKPSLGTDLRRGTLTGL